MDDGGDTPSRMIGEEHVDVTFVRRQIPQDLTVSIVTHAKRFQKAYIDDTNRLKLGKAYSLPHALMKQSVGGLEVMGRLSAVFTRRRVSCGFGDMLEVP